MYRCPSCHKNGISRRAKFLYTVWSLPTCRYCGEQAVLSFRAALGLLLTLFVAMSVIVPVVFILIGLLSAPYIGAQASVFAGLAVTFVMSCAAVFATWHLMPLRAKRKRAG